MWDDFVSEANKNYVIRANFKLWIFPSKPYNHRARTHEQKGNPKPHPRAKGGPQPSDTKATYEIP